MQLLTYAAVNGKPLTLFSDGVSAAALNPDGGEEDRIPTQR